MGLLTNLNTARAALSATSLRTQAHSQNIYNANTPGYSRISADRISTGIGRSELAITRYVDNALLHEFNRVTSNQAAATVTGELLRHLDPVSANPADELSLVALISNLSTSMVELERSPDDALVANTVFSAAANLSSELRSSSERAASAEVMVQDRLEAEVTKLQSALTAYGEADKKLGRATEGTVEHARQLDAREQALNNISAIVDVEERAHTGGGGILATEAGVVLYDKQPRHIDVSINGSMVDISIDGVNVTSEQSRMPLASGVIYALKKFQTEILAPYNYQIDEISRNLIELFSESGPPPLNNRPPVQGLFVSAIPLVLGSDTYVDGMAGAISINPNAINSGSGLVLFRDGVLGASADHTYNRNPSGLAGYSERITELINKLDGDQNFDINGQLGGTTSIGEYALTARGWLNEHVATTKSRVEHVLAQSARIGDLRHDRFGVDLDTELQVLLEIEHSYQATVKLIASVDQMLQSLLQIVN